MDLVLGNIGVAFGSGMPTGYEHCWCYWSCPCTTSLDNTYWGNRYVQIVSGWRP